MRDIFRGTVTLFPPRIRDKNFLEIVVSLNFGTFFPTVIPGSTWPFFFLVFLEFGRWDIFFIGNFLPLTLGHFRCMHGIPESDQNIFLVNNVFDNGNACVHCMIGCLVRCSKKNFGRQVQYRTVRKFGFVTPWQQCTCIRLEPYMYLLPIIIYVGHCRSFGVFINIALSDRTNL